MPITTTNDLGYVILKPELAKQFAGSGFEAKRLGEFEASMLLSNLPAESRGEHPQIDKLPFVPTLHGESIYAHYEAISQQLLAPFSESMQRLATCQILPLPPAEAIKLKPGWQRYTFDIEAGWLAESVQQILEESFFYDCETFVKGSTFGHPIIGTALSDKAYYIWLHPDLLSDSDAYTPCMPELRNSQSFIAIHNSAFDSCRILDRYRLSQNQRHFYFDTMSAQQLIAGCDRIQRWQISNFADEQLGDWANYASEMSLVACYEHWSGCKLPADAKDPRKLFVQADSLAEIRAQLLTCVEYAINDCYLGLYVFQAQYPRYLQQAPSKVVLAGHMLANQAVLPVQDDWHEWLIHCENTYNRLQNQIKQAFTDIADALHAKWQADEFSPEFDPWCKTWDWRFVSENPESPYYKIARWYRPRFDSKALLNVGTKTDFAHQLLRLCYEGQPIFKHKEMGWCYDEENPKRIPHKNGIPNTNVGNLLTDGYLRYFETDLITSEHAIAREIIQHNRLCTYWAGYRARLFAMHTQLAENPRDGSKPCTLLAPQGRVHGTITGRQIEPTWATLASFGHARIGSELRAKVRAPKGYKLVSFDTDQQELQIARVYADSYMGISGSTPFSFQVLAGDKANGTDMHSANAKLCGMGRDAAKQVASTI